MQDYLQGMIDASYCPSRRMLTIGRMRSKMKHDDVMPDAKWVFDDNVTNCFDDMLKRSIPQYDIMRQTVACLGARFIRPDTDVVDMGCSRGEVINSLLEYAKDGNTFYGLEVSNSMITGALERFKYTDGVKIQKCDLRNEFPNVNASLILSVLTLQFTPIEYRQEILARVYKSIISGGAFILVEKVIGSTSEIDNAMRDEYYTLKSRNGYSQEQILRKKLSLEGVLVPVTASMNVEFLRSSGFNQIDCFWRWMNFSAWIAIKK